MTGRTSSQSSDSSRAGTSKNALLSDATKTGHILSQDDVHDKWSQSTVSFDFDKMNADDFLLNDDFSIHKNDEALLADFTALLEDGDDAIMHNATTAGTNVTGGDSGKEKESNKIDANLSTSTAPSLNSSGGEILVTTATQRTSEQLSQSIGSIMSDHDYLTRENILEIMNNDEENFFSQGFPKPVKLEMDSMEVNLSGNVPPTLMSQSQSQPQPESVGSAAIAAENIANDASSPTVPATVADDIIKSILADEVAPLLVKLTTTGPKAKENLAKTLCELETKMVKLKRTLVVEGVPGDAPSGVGEITNSETPIDGDKPSEPTPSECDSDAIFSCDRSEPLEYYGIAKGQSATTTDESSGTSLRYENGLRAKLILCLPFSFPDDEFVSKLKAELNTADALNDESRLTIKSYRRDIAASSAQVISIKFATHLERMSADLLRIAAKFKPPASGHPSNEAGERDGSTAIDKSKEQLLAEFSSTSSSAINSTDDEGNDVPRVKRKKKSRGNKADPNLSQINGIDDEDNILVKNEPLLDTQLMNGHADAASKNVNVIDELNKWNGKEWKEHEGEFYGFDATDTDDCANSSIEIGVKTEPASQSLVTSASEKKPEDSEATQAYSVEEELAKVSTFATSPKNSGDTPDSSKTPDAVASVESTNAIAEAVPAVDKVDGGDANEEDDLLLRKPMSNPNDSSSENDASDEDDNDDDVADEDNDREIAR